MASGGADPGNTGCGPAEAAAGAQVGGLEHLGKLFARVGSAMPADQLQRGGQGATGTDAAGGDLVGGAGVPAHADADFDEVSMVNSNAEWERRTVIDVVESAVSVLLC